MKKLKIKVFFVIFSLLTVFTLIIFISGTAKDYMDRKNTVTEVLTKIPRTFENIDKNRVINGFNPTPDDLENDYRRIYLDFTIYTVILDEDGNYKGLINNTNNDDIEEEYIEKIANDIINNHKESIYIGNLYTSKYAYAFTANNTLIIMDNTDFNNSLVKSLIINTLLFIIGEIAICGFTYLITRWIIAPVNESFEKQKTFVADASHELKTPLSVMIASADAYFNDGNVKWVKNMKNESERMIKLVTDLLDLAKTEQEQNITMGENNLSDIIESSILTFESLFYENNIKLKYDIMPDIKKVCNEDLIVELMSILIDNAIKHCSENGEISVILRQIKNDIIFEVKNMGKPIPKEEQEKIFERFYRADEARNRDENRYGLGLAIAKNIVEGHNGKISATSEGGVTTFRISLKKAKI